MTAAFFLLLLANGAYAPQQAGSAPLEPALEARVQKLGKELRCAVCQGLSIADSPASMARAQLDKVRELVATGRSDDEIRAYFVARYGEWVLLSPRAEGFNWLVWLGPAILLAIGFAVILWQITRRAAPRTATTAQQDPDAAHSGTSPTSADDYLRVIRSELER